MLRPRAPARTLVALFMAVIALGTVLLQLPISAREGSVGWSTAFFTSTSAVCVTGLSVVDIASTYSFFGQVVLLLLIQVGGLGYMLASTLLFLLLGGEVGLHDRLLLRDTLGQVALRDTRRLVLRAIKFTFFAEGVGALLLWLLFWHTGRYDGLTALWHGIFHAVSAFCNAGFDIKGVSESGVASLGVYRTHWGVNGVVSALIICGGLGFVTCSELWEWNKAKRRRALSLTTRLILWGTASLLVGGMAVFLFAEWTNPKTLGPLSLGDKLMTAGFQSVTLRTAGFSTLDFGQMRSITLLISGLWMFIGAAPGGTGGGLKITTFAAVLLAVKSTLRAESDAEIFGRRIATRDVFRSMVLLVLAFAAIVAGTFSMAFTEPQALMEAGYRDNLFMQIQFEVISAFCTVGLSAGVTGALTESGRAALIVLMFLGRLGPTTVAAAMAAPRTPPRRRLAKTELILG
ncbi:MAG: Trk family potassium uptake protein [Armatimonadetes bacterium]|nr:Trk family potassium uptake protein [Armatimonadota bacterium]